MINSESVLIEMVKEITMFFATKVSQINITAKIFINKTKCKFQAGQRKLVTHFPSSYKKGLEC